MAYKIAVVVTDGQPVSDSYITTYHNIHQVITSDKRYSRCEVNKVAWNDKGDVDWTQFTHILMSDELIYTENPKEFLKWMNELQSDAKDRIVNPYDAILWNVDKTYLLEYKNKGVRIAPTVFVPPERQISLAEAINQLKQQGAEDHRIVVKNIVDADGISTILIPLESIQAENTYRDALKKSQSGVIVQEFLPAIRQEGEWSLIFLDKKLSHGVKKTPHESEFRIQSRYGGSEVVLSLEEIPEDIKIFAQQVIRATSHKLVYARVDIVRNKNGLPCLMELEAFEPSLYLYSDDIKQKFVQCLLSYKMY